MIFEGAEIAAIPDNSSMTREEYKFSLFINRIRDIFKEILIKPMWTQFCIHHPNFSTGTMLKNALGLEFVEENVFALAKEKAILEQGTAIVQSLAGLQNADQTPVFSMRFLLQKYLSLSDDDWPLNKKMMEEEKKEQEAAGAAGATAGGGDMGGGISGADFGSGMDMGGGDMVANMSGSDIGANAGADFGADTSNDIGGELPQATPPDLEGI